MKNTNVDTELQAPQGRFGILAGVHAVARCDLA